VTGPQAASQNPGAARADGRATPTRFSWRHVALTLAALGVVYGDIGTSPLYAVRQSAADTIGPLALETAVMGTISIIFWSLMIVVTGKYMQIVLRADNKGEGGSLALAALTHRSPGLPRWMKSAIPSIAVLGLALFYGEAVLTPAVSVLSAVEGLQVEEPRLTPFVVPISLLILIGLFVIQSRGTAKIGRLFGPVMLLWFFAIGFLGLRSIAATPEILLAINPVYGAAMFFDEPWVAFVALGSIVLCVTGVESLYADMGHFGAKPIRIAWYFFALPALVLNYFGQGAAILRDAGAAEHAFFALATEGLHYPLVGLATVAAVIASQAVISGSFSITSQAVQLGLFPRMEVRHTSATDYGQIYMPRVNTLMLLGVIIAVLLFRNSTNLTGAYGVAVTAIMLISSLLVAVVARKQWGWSTHMMIAVFGPIFIIDVAYFSSTMLKFAQGGWFPVVIAALVILSMDSWRVGRRVLTEKTYGTGLSTPLFLERAEKTPIRVAGTAVFITPRLDEVPGALLHNLKHNKVLHERVIFLRVDVRDVPFVPAEKRLTVEKLGKGFFSVEAHFGFFETPNVPRALDGARAFGLAIDIEETTFFVRRETLVPARRSALAKWRRKLFIRLYASALEAAQFYRLPPGRVVELGSQTEI
jgi:KUP system potassium uptake protein